jgi:tRNA (guanine-N7-)-methyltransferase
MHTRRPIRSFVLRAGRVTAAQERALKELWPAFGLNFASARIDLEAAFGRSSERCLDPHIDYLGIEVHRSGVGRLLLEAAQAELANLRVICHDAVEVLTAAIPDHSFDAILIFFPDPWHKKRHHKRRLIDASFVQLLAEKLRPRGVLRLATDWQAYAEQMLEVCNACTGLASLSADESYVPRPEFRPPTRFERRGERLGHGVWDLAYEKRGAEGS